MDKAIDDLFDTMGIPGIDVPKYGWRVTLDWTPSVKCKPFKRPRWHQINGFVMPALRYLFHVYRPSKRDGKLPFIDALNARPWRPIYGVPMGGIGSGSINRGFRGNFCRHSLIAGMYEYGNECWSGTQFIVTIRNRGGVPIYQRILTVSEEENDGIKKSEANETSTIWPQGWEYGISGARAAYVGLFPRAWTVYDIQEHRVKLYCRQVSPVLPHDYKDSCLPVCVFEWHVLNYGKESVQVSLSFALQCQRSGQGIRTGKGAGFIGELGTGKAAFPYCLGVSVDVNGTEDGYYCSLNPDCFEETQKVWNSLMTTGSVPELWDKEKGKLIIAGGKVDVEMHSISDPIRFALAWHSPKVKFRAGETLYWKRYCRWLDDCEDLASSCGQLLEIALSKFDDWERNIVDWQRSILERQDIPDWFKSSLFNELYYVVDGGTVWLDKDKDRAATKKLNDVIDKPIEGRGDDEESYLHLKDAANEIRENHRLQYGVFGYLESHEYRMFNTYDVHYYSSWALITLWPRIQESIQFDVADATSMHDQQMVTYVHSGRREARSVQHSVPHDMGDPEDEPFVRINAYQMYNTDDWKDLNSKLVLQVYRDWRLTGNTKYLVYMWPTVLGSTKRCIKWDKDGDGVIENSGYADQTYDAWSVKGVSAYTGGLWLASLYAICEMGKYLKQNVDFLESLLEKGLLSYEKKLWTGSYFRYDERTNSVMTDQLCGHWYLRCSELHLPSTVGTDGRSLKTDKVKSALSAIYKRNCYQRRGGSKRSANITIGGAINGCLENGYKDISSVQAEEFWVGVNYSVACLMLIEGLDEEGWAMAEGTYRTVWQLYGLQYQTPEAYFDDGRFRALGYMRPLSIWSIYHWLSVKGSVSLNNSSNNNNNNMN